MKIFFTLIRISLRFAAKGPIDNKSALIQVMAWGRHDDKPLPETMLTHFATHISGTRGRWWVKSTVKSLI